MGKTFSKCVTAQEDSTEKLDIGPSEFDVQNTNISNGHPPSTIPKREPLDIRELLTRPLQHDYNMYHKRRGTAFIFNHEKFNDLSMGKRTGTAVDSGNLQSTFKQLGFDVRVYNDQTLKEILHTLRDYARMDHSDDDCVIVTILSHGEIVPFVDKKTGEESHTILAHDQLSYIHAKDIKYPLQMIFKYFTDQRCPTLKDKPRIFIIQACQGDDLDEGITLVPKKKKIEKDGIDFEPLKMEPILPHKDFLIAYSTLPGFYSFRNSRFGSWFIRELCKELNANGGIHDLIGMLTYVTQTVAYDYESQNADNDDLDQKKQIPCVVSMLTKLLYFPKAINQMDESP